MILDRDKLVRIMHDQVKNLFFGKEYEKVVLRKSEAGPDARPMHSTQEFLSHFWVMQDFITTKWQPMEIPDSHIPALVVTPFSVVELKEQIKRLESNGNPGISDIEEEWITNLEKDIPDEPYLLIDIDTGDAGNAPGGLDETCHVLTVNEGVQLATQYLDILSGYFPCLLSGSRSSYYYRRSPDGVSSSIVPVARDLAPFLWLVSRGSSFSLAHVHVCLTWHEEYHFREYWRVPSCALRIDPWKY